jgi:hypothetical protein
MRGIACLHEEVLPSQESSIDEDSQSVSLSVSYHAILISSSSSSSSSSSIRGESFHDGP